MNSLTSNSLFMMEKSLNFLWAKQSAVLDNISNAETPNYKTKYVTFEEQFNQRLLAASKKDGAGGARTVLEDSSWKVNEANESTRMDGNGVNVTEQSAELIRNTYQLQYVMQSISSDLATLRSAIVG